MTAIRELDAAELDLVAGGGVGGALVGAGIAALCKTGGEAFAGGLISGLGVRAAGIVPFIGGVAAAGCALGWFGTNEPLIPDPQPSCTCGCGM